jgi:hypothetical protein
VTNIDFRGVQLTGKSSIDRKGTGALDHDGQGDGAGEKVEFNAFTLLITKPVCEQTKMPVHRDHSYQHVAEDAEGGDTTEKAEKQANAAEKLGANGKESESRRNVQALGEKTHGGGETIAPKPAESFLRAMGEENQAEDEAENGDGQIVGGVDELTKHEMALLFVG